MGDFLRAGSSVARSGGCSQIHLLRLPSSEVQQGSSRHLSTYSTAPHLTAMNPSRTSRSRIVPQPRGIAVRCPVCLRLGSVLQSSEADVRVAGWIGSGKMWRLGLLFGERSCLMLMSVERRGSARLPVLRRGTLRGCHGPALFGQEADRNTNT